MRSGTESRSEGHWEQCDLGLLTQHLSFKGHCANKEIAGYVYIQYTSTCCDDAAVQDRRHTSLKPTSLHRNKAQLNWLSLKSPQP